MSKRRIGFFVVGLLLLAGLGKLKLSQDSVSFATRPPDIRQPEPVPVATVATAQAQPAPYPVTPPVTPAPVVSSQSASTASIYSRAVFGARFAVYRTNPSEVSDNLAENLARFDLVVLDFDAYFARPEGARRIKQLNPGVKILMYFNPMELFDPAYRPANGRPRNGTQNCYAGRNRLHGLYNQVTERLSAYWVNAQPGNVPVHWWLQPPMRMLNLSLSAPSQDGRRWCEYVAEWHLANTLNDPFWDGVFVDNAWENISWVAEQKKLGFDLNGDGRPDTNEEMDIGWSDGVRRLLQLIRRAKGNDFIMVGNKPNLEFAFDDDGRMLCGGKMSENFPEPCFQGNWGINLYHYRQLCRRGLPYNLIMSHGLSQGTDQTRRFGLASALLQDGMYVYKQDSSRWWDEFDQARRLGRPVADAAGPSSLSFAEYFEGSNWQSRFESLAPVTSSGLVNQAGESWLRIPAGEELVFGPFQPGRYTVSFRYRAEAIGACHPALVSRDSWGSPHLEDQWSRWPASVGYVEITLQAESRLIIKADGSSSAILVDDIEVFTPSSSASPVWTRQFENGLVLCNPTLQEQVYTAGDREVTLPPRDGFILLRNP